MELYNGRPADCTGRLDRERETYDLLDRLGIAYQRTDHAPADTMEVCNVIDAVLGVLICKNLFLCNRQKTKFYLMLMPGDKPFKTKDLSHQLGVARLSFGTPEDMERLLNVTPGSVSVMGLQYDRENQVQLVADRAVLEQEYFGCHPCINTSSLKLKTADVVEKFLPAVHHEMIQVTL
ncbi:MAG: prolyl-tRNA synthetase associated domain-containing protein [Clostridiales bacterium]|nr:prolyl-tRNA synthetase associated domain-containing protein [Clostridiales bacterium]